MLEVYVDCMMERSLAVVHRGTEDLFAKVSDQENKRCSFTSLRKSSLFRH